MNPYATHQKMLRKVVEATTGPVLELGVGESSTPLLHELCARRGRLVVSYDSDPKYFEEMRARYEGPKHQFYLVERDDWDKAPIECAWDVVLVDHRPAARRQVDAARLAPHAKFVVCHDTEPENDRFYRWERGFRAFRYRYHDASQTPHTTVLSSSDDLMWLADRRGSTDLTIIHYTSGHLDKVRPYFAERVREQILRSTEGEFPIVTVSHEPLVFGDDNIVVGPVERGHMQIYKNILLGARSASTDYVGLSEDDVMVHPSHWRVHRPPPHKFSYDFNKWGLNTWVKPAMFGYRSRAVINQLIAPRQLLIEALEERFALYPDYAAMVKKFGKDNPLKFWGDLGRYEKHLGVTVREWEPFSSLEPSVVFSHSEAFGYLSQGTRKSVGENPRTELPYWGSAQGMMDLWEQQEQQVA